MDCITSLDSLSTALPPSVGYEHGVPTGDGTMQTPGLIFASPEHVPKMSMDGDKNLSSGKDNKKDRKGRATFSGNQIDELEKAFQTTQYLTTAERARLAERLQLTESQVKIWFQNRRTKCRRTSWKSKEGGKK